MSIKISAWNIKDGCSDPDRWETLRAATAHLSPDVAVFSEAYAEDKSDKLGGVFDDLNELGYDSYTTLYEDTDGRKDRHGLMVIIDKEISRGQPIKRVRLAGRYALRATIHDRETGNEAEFVGAHLDDRSGVRREAMVRTMGGLIVPDIFAGDLNSSDRNDPFARKLRLLRPARPFMKPFYEDPDPTKPTTGFKRKLVRQISLGYRTIDMAADHVMEQLEDMGLRDSDLTHAPTIPAENPRLRLDHIMVGNRVRVLGKGVCDYNAAADSGIYDPVSDHLAIWAELEILPEAA